MITVCGTNPVTEVREALSSTSGYWKGFLSEAFPYWYSMFQFCDTRMARELVYRWVYRYTRGRHVVDTLLILIWHVTPSTVCFVPMPLGKRRCRVRQRRLSRTRNSWELHDVDLTARTTARRPLLVPLTGRRTAELEVDEVERGGPFSVSHTAKCHWWIPFAPGTTP